MTSVIDQLTDVLVARFGVDAEEVQEETSMQDLDLDSLALVEFSLVAQKEFGVEVSEDELGADSTVRDVAELLESKQKALTS